MILIVDDEASIRQFVRIVLERAGYQVSEAAGAEEALAILRAGPAPELLLTDIVMPVRNGIWLAAQVHRILPKVPVLFVSGFSQDYKEELTGSVCLQKPFTAAALTAAVNDIVEARRSAS